MWQQAAPRPVAQPAPVAFAVAAPQAYTAGTPAGFAPGVLAPVRSISIGASAFSPQGVPSYHHIPGQPYVAAQPLQKPLGTPSPLQTSQPIVMTPAGPPVAVQPGQPLSGPGAHSYVYTASQPLAQPLAQPGLQLPVQPSAGLQAQPTLQPTAPVPAGALAPVLPPGKVLTATMEFDGQLMEIKYGPGQDYESPADFFTPCRTEWREPYMSMLQFLDGGGWFDNLPLDSQGILRVSAPFCGSIQELPILAAFLEERFGGKPGVSGVHLLCSDVVDWDRKGGYWRQKERYVARKHKGISLQFQQIDLATQTHPSSALTLGIHPECTVSTSIWERILANVIRTTTGTCVIATFKEGEKEVVSRVCKSLGANFEVHKNPHWTERELPPGNIPPFLQFLVLVRGAGR